jgi:hypothetical protein
MKKHIINLLILGLISFSCVSKNKYLSLQKKIAHKERTISLKKIEIDSLRADSVKLSHKLFEFKID